MLKENGACVHRFLFAGYTPPAALYKWQCGRTIDEKSGHPIQNNRHLWRVHSALQRFSDVRLL
jgi:hypothetical protein